MSRLTSDDFKSRNEIVERVFYSVVNATYKNPRKVYKYCYKEMNFNITRLQEHLDKCKSYRAGKSSNAMPETKWGDDLTLLVIRNSPYHAL